VELALEQGLINYIDTKAKCRHLKLDFVAALAGAYLSEAPSLPES